MEEITIIKAMLIVLFTIYLLTLIVLLQAYLELKDFFKEIKTDKEVSYGFTILNNQRRGNYNKL